MLRLGCNIYGSATRNTGIGNKQLIISIVLFVGQEAVTAVAAGDVKPSEQGKYPVKQQEAAAKPPAPARPLPKSAVPVVNSEVRVR